MADNVHHPQHYQGTKNFECLEIMKFIFGDGHTTMYAMQNAFKYIWRDGQKGDGREDAEKAQEYIDWAMANGFMNDNAGWIRLLETLQEKVNKILGTNRTIAQAEPQQASDQVNN